MIQLVTPNLNAVGAVAMCLEYASRGVFNNPAEGSTAWNAWKVCGQRFDSIPTDVQILCWFSYFVGTVNEGHVVVGNPVTGFYSSPYSLSASAQYQEGTTTHAHLPSIAVVEQFYHAKFVGWSLDILGLKVAEENQVIEPQTIISTFADFDAGVPTASQLSYYGNHPGGYATLYLDLLKYNHDERMALQAGQEYVPYAGAPLFTKK